MDPPMAHADALTPVRQTASFLHEARKAFRLIDVNDDGKISPDELASVFTRLEVSDADFASCEGWDVLRTSPSSPTTSVADLIRRADRDGDGHIDFDEFLVAARAAPCNCRAIGAPCWHERADLLSAFQLFDRDDSGAISAEELQEAIRRLSGDRVSVEDCRRMIARVDSNGDGMVDFNEFSNMMDGVFG